MTTKGRADRTARHSYARNKRLVRLYGITAAQYDLMLEMQEGVCAICLRPPRKQRLHVDHDHKTGRVRGLLCYLCNRKLVGRHRSGELLRKAAAYLDSTFDGRVLVVEKPSSPGARRNSSTPNVRSKRS